MRRFRQVLTFLVIAVLLAGIVRLSRDRQALLNQIGDHLARDSVELTGRFQERLILHTSNFQRVTWLGAPVWQSVMDLWTLQEAVAQVRPALFIECGTWKGGSALFVAHLMDLMGRGRVVSVDIEKFHDLTHPRITFLLGDCAADSIVTRIRTMATEPRGPVMVMLDSDHSAAHVAREMAAYAPLVTPGSYLHVQDGVIDLQPMFAAGRPGPLRAIEAFLPEHAEFTVDTGLVHRFLITQHPGGWLRRRR